MWGKDWGRKRGGRKEWVARSWHFLVPPLCKRCASHCLSIASCNPPYHLWGSGLSPLTPDRCFNILLHIFNTYFKQASEKRNGFCDHRRPEGLFTSSLSHHFHYLVVVLPFSSLHCLLLILASLYHFHFLTNSTYKDLVQVLGRFPHHPFQES